MPQETFLLSGPKIRRLRETKNWRQSDLATRAGLCLREIQSIERDKDKTVSKATMDLVASALGVDAAEIFLARLTTWQWVPELRDKKLERKLSRAVRLDMEGNHEKAVEITREVLETLKLDGDPAAYSSVFVKLVTFLDHLGEHREVLDLVDEFLEQAKRTAVDGAQVTWALYHRGICLRRMERFDEARPIFERLRREQGHDFRTSSLHQLGVLDLELARRASDGPECERLLASALRIFEQCLREWKWLGPTHREGFTLQRLGQAYALMGDRRRALEWYHKALTVFAWHRCTRYIELTMKDIRIDVLDEVFKAPAGRPRSGRGS